MSELVQDERSHSFTCPVKKSIITSGNNIFRTVVHCCFPGNGEDKECTCKQVEMDGMKIIKFEN